MIVKDKIFLIALVGFFVLAIAITKLKSFRCDPKWINIRQKIKTLDNTDSTKSMILFPTGDSYSLVTKPLPIYDGAKVEAIRLMIADRKKGYAGKTAIWSAELKVIFLSGDSVIVNLLKVNSDKLSGSTYIDFSPDGCDDETLFYSSILGDYLEEQVRLTEY